MLGFLGYSLGHAGDSYAMWVPDGPGCSFGVVRVEPGMADDPYIRGRAGFHHLAFNAESRDQIDQLYGLLLEIEATVLDPPVACTEYGPTYYAVYFEDPDGMKLEVVHA